MVKFTSELLRFVVFIAAVTISLIGILIPIFYVWKYVQQTNPFLGSVVIILGGLSLICYKVLVWYTSRKKNQAIVKQDQQRSVHNAQVSPD